MEELDKELEEVVEEVKAGEVAEKVKSFSPIPIKKDPTVGPVRTPAFSPSHIKVNKGLSFGNCLLKLSEEEESKYTKLEWKNKEIYITIEDDKLMIHLEDKTIHTLIVSKGDIMGTDWVKV